MARGWLNAIHADTGEVMWVWNAPTPLLPGVIPTAGGIVMAGDLDGVLRVFDKVNGAQLASHALGGPISGGVITYNDDGTEAGPQLVAVASAMNAPVWDWKDGPAEDHRVGAGGVGERPTPVCLTFHGSRRDPSQDYTRSRRLRGARRRSALSLFR